MGTQALPCKFYLSGGCSAGRACLFSHDEQSASAKCRFFLRGACKYGSACLLSHDSGDAPAPRPPLGTDSSGVQDALGGAWPVPAVATGAAGMRMARSPPTWSVPTNTASGARALFPTSPSLLAAAARSNSHHHDDDDGVDDEEEERDLSPAMLPAALAELLTDDEQTEARGTTRPTPSTSNPPAQASWATAYGSPGRTDAWGVGIPARAEAAAAAAAAATAAAAVVDAMPELSLGDALVPHLNDGNDDDVVFVGDGGGRGQWEQLPEADGPSQRRGLGGAFTLIPGRGAPASAEWEHDDATASDPRTRRPSDTHSSSQHSDATGSAVVGSLGSDPAAAIAAAAAAARSWTASSGGGSIGTGTLGAGVPGAAAAIAAAALAAPGEHAWRFYDDDQHLPIINGYTAADRLPPSGESRALPALDDEAVAEEGGYWLPSFAAVARAGLDPPLSGDDAAREAWLRQQAAAPLCPYGISGNCRYAPQCRYLHGDPCPICGRDVLHPFRPEEHAGTSASACACRPFVGVGWGGWMDEWGVTVWRGAGGGRLALQTI
jgi:hypothetical protein